jgi:hypothetical protein
MSKWGYKVRLRISRYYIAHLYSPPKGIDAEFNDWNHNGSECTASFVCSDDYPNPFERYTKEDLQEYVIKTFGANIIKDLTKVRQDPNLPGNNTLINHPLLDRYKRDTYKKTYDLLVTREQLEETSRALGQVNPSTLKGFSHIFPFKVVPNSSYKKDDYILRIGQW